MKFFVIVLSLFCYLLGQTTTDARATGLRKAFFTLPNHNDYQGDSYQFKNERRRQAGWGKRGDAVIDDESDDPYVFHDNLAHAWFEDQ